MCRIALIVSLLFLSFAFNQAGDVSIQESRLIPKLLNYQGYLTDTLGIPIDDTLDVTFKVFDAVSSGNELWSEMQTNVPIERGVFSVMLGGITPIPDSVFADFTSTWLELTLEGPQTLTPRTRIVSSAYAYTATYSDTALYAINAVPDNDWNFRVTDGADTTLQMNGRWGMARFGNTMIGNADSTHTNLGIGSTTGFPSQNFKYCTIGGGYGNTARGPGATISGGYGNSEIVNGNGATIGGGYYNSSNHEYTTVGGGYSNYAGQFGATISGGYDNNASSYCATISGGYQNVASTNDFATVGGGRANVASSFAATVGGGTYNTASASNATVGGGTYNTASANFAIVTGGYYNGNAGDYSAILGGYADTITAAGDYSYLFGINSNLTQDSTFMVDMPHIWFGTEAAGYEFPTTDGTNGQALVTDGSGQVSWAATNDNDWNFLVSDGADTTLQMGGRWGLARFGNTMYGNADSTHVNFGVACTTGTNGQNYGYCTVGGGYYNSAGGGFSATVSGGDYNKANGNRATVGGGQSNTASGWCATVSGGIFNTASNWYATVGGGEQNGAGNQYATVGGGRQNTASGWIATVSGGWNNTASSDRATVSGGEANMASDQYTTVGGGQANIASSVHATVAGGRENTASGYAAIVGGGWGNIASGYCATVGGGGDNDAGEYATVGGGGFNHVAGRYSAILGGYADTIAATGDYSYLFGINSNLTQDSTFMVDMPHIWFGTEAAGYEFPTTDGTNGQALVTDGSGQLSWGASPSDNDWVITGTDMYSGVTGNVGIGISNPLVKLDVNGIICGGVSDTVKGVYGGVLAGYSNLAGDQVGDTAATVVSGWNNSAIADYSFVGGGNSNTASYVNATIVGGDHNTASGHTSFIGGGYNNNASIDYATICGGGFNNASGVVSTVAGGNSNTTSGNYAFIGGGSLNTASGHLSVVAGGQYNTTIDSFNFIGSGDKNHNAGKHSAVLCGYADTITAAADYSYLFGINSNLTQDSTFMVDMPHVWFGTEAAGYEFPTTDGSADQVMVTNGSGQLSWTNKSPTAFTPANSGDSHGDVGNIAWDDDYVYVKTGNGWKRAQLSSW